MKVYIGADHRGFELKEKISKWLFEWEYEFLDIGADHLDPKDNYPLYAQEVASLVSKDKKTKGVLVCGSGVGMDITANKFDGVRASIGISVEQVRVGRHDDDMNILVIAADYVSEDDVRGMLKVFLETKFAAKARFKKRLEEIKKIEANN
jgi:ribose 5-phosphate isomerase B